MDVEEEASAQPTQVVDVRFHNARNGDYVTFSSSLCDQFSNVHATPLYITVRINMVMTQVDVNEQTGEPIYGYVATPTVEISSEWKHPNMDTRGGGTG